MKNKKLGFTLGEVLVSLAIIGIIMALAAHTIKMAKASYTALTYYAYHNVQAIASELLSGRAKANTSSGSELDTSIILCRAKNVYDASANKGILVNIIAPDSKNDNIPICYLAGDPANNGGTTGDTNLFCKYTTYISNTTGTTRCGDSNLFAVEYDNSIDEPKIKGVVEKWDTPNFISSNGQRYYISKWDFNANVSELYGYRIVAVDLNGKSGPNIQEYNNDEIMPDIVQFLILDSGEVYPIGVAGSNVNIGTKVVTYLNTRIKGYNYTYNASRTANIPADCYSTKGASTPDLCNYAVMYLQMAENSSFFSYKEAFCGAFEGTEKMTFKSYCNKNYNLGGAAIGKSSLCPPSSNAKRVDQCDIKVIKPAFRFNLR